MQSRWKEERRDRGEEGGRRKRERGGEGAEEHRGMKTKAGEITPSVHRAEV